MPIQVLPPEVAGKIAAGEVIERPASVVKELVENSIDAGARDIRVEIREGGQRLIRVIDDGCGIPASEVALAFARHATSKLTSVADLSHIDTLGFRGEALASIAAVSQVTLITRPRDQATGHILRVDGGRITHDGSQGSPPGTIMTVEHLFRNIPARLKFLRQAQTEAGHVYTVVAHYALAHPAIRFNLTTDGRQQFHSTGNGRAYDVLIALHGLDVAEQMLEIADETARPEGLSVLGFVGKPGLHRANRTYITFFVNRRWIQDRSLTHAVVQAYHTLLPVGRSPVSVLFLQMGPGDVDVNVHPTKREVKFRDGHLVFNTVQRAVRQTLVDNAPVPTVIQAPRGWPTPDWQRRQALTSAGHHQTNQAQISIEMLDATSAPDQPLPVGPVRLPLLRLIGQVGQTYIVAEGPQGMYLVDQHAAHERVLFEQLQAAHQRNTVSSQALLAPAVLDLDPLLAGTLAENMAMLNRVGFQIEAFGGSSFLLRAVPAILAVADVRSALVDILEMLRAGEDPLAMQAEERLIAAVCKRAAIKAGQTLAPDEMQHLIRQLEQCASPRTCPHGRPTVLHFSVEQLEREFARR